MSRDLRELLQDTAESPTRPVEAAWIVDEAGRRTTRDRIGIALASAAVILVAVIALPQLWGGGWTPRIGEVEPAGPPEGPVEIPTQMFPVGEDHPGRDALLVGRLGGDAESGCLWIEPAEESAVLGERIAVEWPHGYTAAFDPIRLFDENGTVVARGGDLLELGGGTTDSVEFCQVTEDAWSINHVGVRVPGSGQPDASSSAVVDEAITDPRRIEVDPTSARPGDSLSVSFPEGDTRGPGFVLERRVDGGWVWEWAIHSYPEGDSQNVWSAEEFRQRNVEWEAGPAFGGVGPHVIPVPAEADPGTYRVCTAPGSPALCAKFEVEARQ